MKIHFQDPVHQPQNNYKKEVKTVTKTGLVFRNPQPKASLPKCTDRHGLAMHAIYTLQDSAQCEVGNGGGSEIH